RQRYGGSGGGRAVPSTSPGGVERRGDASARLGRAGAAGAGGGGADGGRRRDVVGRTAAADAGAGRAAGASVWGRSRARNDHGRRGSGEERRPDRGAGGGIPGAGCPDVGSRNCVRSATGRGIARGGGDTGAGGGGGKGR